MNSSTQAPTTNQLLKTEELVSSSQTMPEEWITKHDMRGPWALDGNKEYIRKQLNEKIQIIVALAKSQERAKTIKGMQLAFRNLLDKYNDIAPDALGFELRVRRPVAMLEELGKLEPESLEQKDEVNNA